MLFKYTVAVEHESLWFLPTRRVADLLIQNHSAVATSLEQAIFSEDENVTPENVKHCLDKGEFNLVPFDTCITDKSYNHSARIAYFMYTKGYRDAISIEITTNERYWYCADSVIINDGRHRLMACLLDRKYWIPVSYGGYVDMFEWLFPVKCKEYTVTRSCAQTVPKEHIVFPYVQY